MNEDPHGDLVGTTFFNLGFWISEPYDDKSPLVGLPPAWGNTNDNSIGPINENPR